MITSAYVNPASADIQMSLTSQHWQPKRLAQVANISEDVNLSLAKLALKFNGGLAKLSLTSWVN